MPRVSLTETRGLAAMQRAIAMMMAIAASIFYSGRALRG
jgi:hypothetical protein